MKKRDESIRKRDRSEMDEKKQELERGTRKRGQTERGCGRELREMDTKKQDLEQGTQDKEREDEELMEMDI